MMLGIATLALGIWLYLLCAHGGFWLNRETDTDALPDPAIWPAVTAIVPARDEADVIERAIASLLGQHYDGSFNMILIDDGSSDGTASLARAVATALGSSRLHIVPGTPLPAGWTGKLWAMAQGVAQTPTEIPLLWFTDADIIHAPDTLRTLVARALQDKLVLNSSMAKLRCDSPAERMLVPAFIFFFRMLYPFGRVNQPTTSVAAAAGGCMLVRRDALDRAGGIGAIANAIIDDCTMGAALKKQGPIRLQLTERSASIRSYGGWRDIGAMIARSAYAQLRYSPLLLAATLAGMILVYIVPPCLALAGSGLARIAGVLAWAIMAITFQPILRFYGRSPLWGIALPAIAAFYTAATLVSALHHWQGRGGMWKDRAQAQLQP